MTPAGSQVEYPQGCEDTTMIELTERAKAKFAQLVKDGQVPVYRIFIAGFG